MFAAALEPRPEKYTEEELLEICNKIQRQSERLANSGTPIGINADDLFSAGQEAVVKALKKFEPDGKHKEIPLIPYALKSSKRAMFALLKSERAKKAKQRSLVVVNDDGEESMPYDDKKAHDPSEIVGAREGFRAAVKREESTALQPVPGNPKILTLSEVRAALPSAVETAKAVDRLRAAVFGSIKVEDIQEIMGVVVQKAKAGDLKATRLLLDQVNGKSAPVTVKHIVSTDRDDLSECG